MGHDTSAEQRSEASRGFRPGTRLLGPHPPVDPRLPAAEVKLDGVPVRLTHLQKVYFPDGTTKRDLLDYNFDVSEFLLPYLRDRPYTLQPFPEGAGGPHFFQKEAGRQMPNWLRTVTVASGGERAQVNFVLCNDSATLLYLVNSGCIDHNVTIGRYRSARAPDFVLLDLDPGARAGFARVVRVAQAIRRVLEKLEVPAFPKTSGATGLHIWIPLASGRTFAQSQRFAALVFKLASRKAPELMTEVLPVKTRPADRVYLDYRQNANAKTIPPPYSPRPGRNAPVSTPLRWTEVTAGLDPASFTIRNLRRRIEKYGDLFAGALAPGKGIKIAEFLKWLDRPDTANGGAARLYCLHVGKPDQGRGGHRQGTEHHLQEHAQAAGD